jgi:hypothetical protein
MNWKNKPNITRLLSNAFLTAILLPAPAPPEAWAAEDNATTKLPSRVADAKLPSDATAKLPPRAAARQPSRVAPLPRVMKQYGWTLRLNTRNQILSLSTPPPELTIAGTPTPNSASPPDPFIAAGMLAMKAKQFDDGLYAAVDLAAQSGCGKLSSKKALLKTLAERLNEEQIAGSNVQEVLLGAARLGKLGVKAQGQTEVAVRERVGDFMSKTELSKPVAFYTWSPELEDIFRQDRMLQTELKGAAGIKKLITLLRSDEKSAADYADHLKFVSGICNPFRARDLRPFLDKSKQETELKIPAKGVCFFPASNSHEDALVQQLFANSPIPDGFNLYDAMIARIDSGKMSLKLRKNSGWYDYQSWALEPLVIPNRMPEARNLDFDEGYRKQLREMFKGLMALSRETQCKNLPAGAGGAGGGPNEIHIYPELTLEPLCSYYYRRARSYSFVHRQLEQSFGGAALAGLHRLSEEGKAEISLPDELTQMEKLFSGACLQCAREIGNDPSRWRLDDAVIPAANAAYFRLWAKTALADPEVAADGRMMVPVFRDLVRKKTKVWLFLGWIHTYVDVRYKKVPAVLSLTPDSPAAGKNDKPVPVFEEETHQVVYPLTAEAYVDKVLDRKEFRKLCDRNNNVLADIVRELSGNKAESEAPQ